ncbi:PEPxxWA-CTERM sorting domain-containing protein [Phenylobacterium sp.]|uniref:PEPxxWA-CTERM sorting domain-containing protein n=1 Tax=Phenylobacterium sp. TaxID=1871053 RepID=UPI0025DC62E9|nr:PEPxxWA-CTERM sorting domain-containing protein [Phenylobacterium sp.]MBX3485595.1 PEP-CTERM sorting domain-containing protein [Phenylobacterium sp.]MCW5758170.1 PEP-CTERM sorting domain-containing protein [Phenylobacterium sp.]
MRKVALAVVSMALFGAGSAAAQDISNITASAGSSYFTPNFYCDLADCGPRETTLGGGAGQFPPAGGEVPPTGGANYNSFVDVGANAITFESSHSVAQGPFDSFSSYSEVGFTFENYNPYEPVNFHSEITPQGLGLYLADTSNGCLFTNSCAQVSDQLYTFADLADANSGILGAVGFSFEIMDNDVVLYSLSGFLALQANPDCPDGYCFVQTLTGEGDAGNYLNGFAQQTDDFDLSARAYGWGATDVYIDLGYGTHNITYKTSVFSTSGGNCIGDTGNICLVAYSGFGDPIGRGGAIDALSLAAFDVGLFTHQDEDLIGGLNFSPQTFRLYYANGELTYATAGVPEPGTWALMIAGFGILGAALRRRHIPAHI